MTKELQKLKRLDLPDRLVDSAQLLGKCLLEEVAKEKRLGIEDVMSVCSGLYDILLPLDRSENGKKE